MHPLKELLENIFIKKYRIGIRVFIILTVILIAVLANMYSNKLDKDENEFLKNLDLNVTFKVIRIVPTSNHGYGIIFGKVINSNKLGSYSAVYQNIYPFCKIIKGKILLVSNFDFYEKNDSVIIDSRVAKYWVYRNDKLVSVYNLTTTTDVFLYNDINKNKYFDIDTYKANF